MENESHGPLIFKKNVFSDVILKLRQIYHPQFLYDNFNIKILLYFYLNYQES